MKFHCRVIGHELIRRVVDREPVSFVKVKLQGEGDMKVAFIVNEEDRVKYPFGSAAVVDFDVQQRMPLEK